MKKIIASILIIALLIITTQIFNINNYNSSSKIYAVSSASETDIQLMARAINGEARGESYEGQVAVGAVILNRVKSSQFPNTIAGVIYE